MPEGFVEDVLEGRALSDEKADQLICALVICLSY
jgi:hypothetical protein